MPSSYPHNPTAANQLLLRSAAIVPGQPFDAVLTSADFDALAQRHHVDFGAAPACVYNPVVTLWAFLSQCLHSAKDCAAAVARVVCLRATLNLALCSNATGGYCHARAKLPVAFVRDLAYHLGEKLEDQAAHEWRWKGRRCLLGDGTSVSAPDTPANQAVYPQPKSQQVGLGFPLIRLVVLLGLATGALVGAALAPWQGKNHGEAALLRSLYPRLRRDDVLLLDAGYCSYWTACLLCQYGVDVVVRLKQARMSKASTGKELSKGDYLIQWTKPSKCPAWLDATTYAGLPETLTLREVHTTVAQRGFRTQKVIVMTTLLDTQLYSAAEVGDLYRQRWHVELDIRSLKTWLKMDILSGQTPEMVQRELWGHLAAYNLVRRLQAQAARSRGWPPRRLSFAAARKQLAATWESLASAEQEVQARLVQACLQGAASVQVGNRPNRCEPRRLKRRPKDCKRLTKPRAAARAEALAGQETRMSKRQKKSRRHEVVAGEQG
jgi:hypothetical protein